MTTHTSLNALWQALEAQPYQHDLYALLRRIESAYALPHPLGHNVLPEHEPVRLGQLPSLAFAPSTIRAIDVDKGGRPTIQIASFGLFGPNGPLPLHLTEYAYERLHQQRDPSLTAFTNLFHHRLISLFYRAWANQQNTVSLDRPDEAFSRYASSISHQTLHSAEADADADLIAPHARLYYAGLLGNAKRCAEGLQQILHDFFAMPVQLIQHIPQWISLPETQQVRLGQATPLNQLPPIGRRLRSVHYKFRLVFGPLSQAQFQSLLPGQRAYHQLIAWVKHYTGIEYAWDVQLVLDKHEVKGIRLGSNTQRLGLSSWLGNRPPAMGHAKDVVLQPIN